MKMTEIRQAQVGFTMVELMVSASILAIGMVLVARGLLTASSTLQTVENRIAAYMFLDEKLMELQQRALEDGGLAPAHESGQAQISGRAAAWTVDIEPMTLTMLAAPPAAPPGAAPGQGAGTISGISPEGAQGTGAPGASTEPPEATFAQVRLQMTWQEARHAQDAGLVTYLGYKAPPAQGREPPS